MSVHTCTTIIEILHKKVGIPIDILDSEKRSWDELGVDSLGITEVCASLEHSQGIHISHEQALQTKNIDDFITLVNTLSKREVE
ncbi:phosphopantetheine-binding protein [Ktedonosporobacter rubrisoli]|nr:phosphopantetheine-binding protein [Ktedonosporobacter rubrisoli]